MRLFDGCFFLPLIAALVTPASPQVTGIKMTVRNTLGASFSTQYTTYFEADRNRMETRSSIGQRLGPHVATITRCDLGKMFMINLDAGKYESIPYPQKALVEALEKAKAQPRPAIAAYPAAPTLRIETTTVDTGERKQMFGRTARHFVITQKHVPLAGSRQMAQQSVTDAWYIDLDMQLSCDPMRGRRAHLYAASISTNGQPEIPEFVDVGEPAKGFPFAQTTKTTGSFKLPDGTTKETTSSSELAVIDFQEGPLDPALFEVPAGFKLVDRVQLNPSPEPPTAWERIKASVSNLFSR
jgi:hypothetical protein